MAETQTFLHASFLIREVARARSFYGGLLGWAEAPRPDLGFPGVWYRIGEAQLHLIVPADPAYLPDPDRPPTGRDSHIAVAVPNFDAIVGQVEASGGRVRHAEMAGKRRAFIRDPDGNMVELWEP
jgi:glyoxylase I family protein